MKPIRTPYDAGYDCGIRGADMVNCWIGWFADPFSASEWERGRKDGEGPHARRSRDGEVEPTREADV